MKLFLFSFLVVWYASLVAAFAGPGAYERLWYYYAYLVDTAGGRAATKVAVGCADNMGTGGRPCSFNEFIKYIDADKDSVKATKDYAVTDDRVPDVERTANILFQKTLTGAYLNNKIRSEVSATDGHGVSKVMTGITGFLAGTVGGADPEIQNGLRQATEATARARMAATLDTISKKLSARGIDMERMRMPLFNDAPIGLVADTLNVPRTVANNHGLTARRLVELVKEEQDPSHKANIDAARDGTAAVHIACGGRLASDEN